MFTIENCGLTVIQYGEKTGDENIDFLASMLSQNKELRLQKVTTTCGKCGVVWIDVFKGVWEKGNFYASISPDLAWDRCICK